MTGEPHNIAVTIWGLPAASEHDAQRGEYCNADRSCVCQPYGGPQAANIPVQPFLANADELRAVHGEHGSGLVGAPRRMVESEDTEVGPIGECERVPFEPSIEVQPTTTSAESPSGLNVSLVVPQAWENPYSLATANLKDTTVTLPEGMTANPSLAAGLGACTPRAVRSGNELLAAGRRLSAGIEDRFDRNRNAAAREKIPGAIYIATPYDNAKFGDAGHPDGSLLALYVVAKDPERGIIDQGRGEDHSRTPSPAS